MVVAFFTGHTLVKKHLNFMGLFNGRLQILQDGCWDDILYCLLLWGFG